MPSGKGPDKPDDDKLRPAVIEEAETTAPEADFDADADKDTGQEVFKLRQEMLKEWDLEAFQIMERHGITKKEAYMRIRSRNRRDGKKTLKETTGDRQDVLKMVDGERIEAQKLDLIAALEPLNDNSDRSLKPKLRLQSHTLYRDMGPWFDVSESEEYRGVKHDQEMILTSLNEIIRTVWHKHAKELKIVELGPGTGDKIKEIILKLLNQMRLGKLNNLGPHKLKHIDLDLVDVSGAMLHLTFVSILRTIRSQLKKMKANQLGEDHPWKEFVEFIELHEKEFTLNEDLATLKIEKSFYAFISDTLKRHDGKPVENILRYALARYFGFKKTDTELLDWLDNDLKLPLDIRPRSATFQSLDGRRFHSTKGKPTLATRLGDEICNAHPDVAIKEEFAGNLIGTAAAFNKRDHEAEVRHGFVDEFNIDATYITFSFQTGTLDHPNATSEEIQADAEKVMPAYDNDPFNHFVSHLFKNPELSTFSDPVTGETYNDHADCYDVVPDYGEDPDNPGFYGTTHHLVFKRDLDISVTISYVEDKVIKEKTQTYKVKKGQEVFLLASYKPTVEQIKHLCEENDLKVVKVYLDDDINQTNAVFLIRAKTDFEKAWDRKRREEEKEERAAEEQEAESEEGDEEVTVHTTAEQMRNKLGRFIGKKHKYAA